MDFNLYTEASVYNNVHVYTQAYIHIQGGKHVYRLDTCIFAVYMYVRTLYIIYVSVID